MTPAWRWFGVFSRFSGPLPAALGQINNPCLARESPGLASSLNVWRLSALLCSLSLGALGQESTPLDIRLLAGPCSLNNSNSDHLTPLMIHITMVKDSEPTQRRPTSLVWRIEPGDQNGRSLRCRTPKQMGSEYLKLTSFTSAIRAIRTMVDAKLFRKPAFAPLAAQ
jgi:hypothetical protein